MSNDYKSLGLDKKDIDQLRQHNLTYLLDKIKSRQQMYELQTMRLQTALERMEKNLAAAREAQMSLLPKGLAGVPEIRFYARFLPSQYVSGDIYNIFRLDERHVGLYHIDISGHGVAAALFSISLSHLLTTVASRRSVLKVPTDEPPYYRICEPDEVILSLDEDQYYEQFGVYFTMIYMIVNLHEHTIRFCRAGHNPPVVIRKNGDTDIFQEGGLPIGWRFPRKDVVGNIQYEPGDLLFLYSDGITDAENEMGKPFSRTRMLDHVRANSKKRMCENIDALLINLKKYCGSDNYEDDISIMGLEFLK